MYLMLPTWSDSPKQQIFLNLASNSEFPDLLGGTSYSMCPKNRHWFSEHFSEHAFAVQLYCKSECFFQELEVFFQGFL